MSHLVFITVLWGTIIFSTAFSSLRIPFNKLEGKRTPRKVNQDLPLSEQCRFALTPTFQNTQWNKARQAIGMKPFEMDKEYIKISRRVKSFYSFSAGISLFNMSNTLVPYLLVWKAGNDAIRGNLLRYEERLAGHKTRGPDMHVYDSPAGVNHVSYKTELASYFPKNTKSFPTPPAFTFVREPLSHFVSGLAEYHFRCQHKKVVTADDLRQEIRDMLDFKALFKDADPCPKLNAYSVRHLYPMAGILQDYGKDDFNLHYIGKLENFDHDWATVNHMYNMNLTFDHKIGVHPTSKDPNNVHKEFNVILQSNTSSDLSLLEAICHIIFVDYACFEYPVPEACNRGAAAAPT